MYSLKTASCLLYMRIINDVKRTYIQTHTHNLKSRHDSNKYFLLSLKNHNINTQQNFQNAIFIKKIFLQTKQRLKFLRGSKLRLLRKMEKVSDGHLIEIFATVKT